MLIGFERFLGAPVETATIRDGHENRVDCPTDYFGNHYVEPEVLGVYEGMTRRHLVNECENHADDCESEIDERFHIVPTF